MASFLLAAATINDVTTRPDAPPGFRVLAQVPENRGRDMSYPEQNAPVQRRAYPDLESIRASVAPTRAFELARDVAVELGWKVVAEDAEALRIEGSAKTPVLGFVDDVVIEITALAEQAVIDLRSKSRVGRGDLGANAKRIRLFRERFRARLT